MFRYFCAAVAGLTIAIAAVLLLGGKPVKRQVESIRLGAQVWVDYFAGRRSNLP